MPFTKDHDATFFDCGTPRLDDWLDKQALKDRALGRSQTHVWLDDGGMVLAYFTLLQSTIRETSDDHSRIKPRDFPRTAELPGILIGKLALDRSIQGKKLSFDLLADAYITAYSAVELIGGSMLVIEPARDNDRLRPLYESFGFESIKGSERMYINFVEFNKGTPF